jgi:hypothetical protein
MLVEDEAVAWLGYLRGRRDQSNGIGSGMAGQLKRYTRGLTW